MDDGDVAERLANARAGVQQASAALASAQVQLARQQSWINVLRKRYEGAQEDLEPLKVSLKKADERLQAAAFNLAAVETEISDREAARAGAGEGGERP